VTARSRDLERAPRTLLAAKVAQVRRLEDAVRLTSLRRRVRGGRIAESPQVRNRFGEVRHGHRFDPGERHFGARLGRADDPIDSGPACALGGDERPRNGTEPPIERQLSDRGMAGESSGGQLARRRQDGQSDRDVESGALLAQPGGSQVDGQSAARPLELGRGDAASNTMLRLLARAIGQPDDRERRSAALEVGFDLDAARIEANKGVSYRPGEHVVTIGDKV
jgi:hypothetical protein